MTVEAMETIIAKPEIAQHSVELSVPASLLEAARSGNPGAQNKIIAKIVDKYPRRGRRRGIGHISWSRLDITTKQQLARAASSGCDCECAACDNGRHCGNEGRGCNL